MVFLHKFEVILRWFHLFQAFIVCNGFLFDGRGTRCVTGVISCVLWP